MIRAVHPGDLDDLVALEAAGAAHPWTSAGIRDVLEGRFGCGWVAGQTHPVGHLLGHVVLDEAEIHTVVVHPDHRRQGLGRALVTHALRAWREAGITAVHLEVRDDNVGAIALYAGLGFEPVGRRRAYYGDCDALLMRCAP
ncbi:MAG: ribosomal protein S18-alanine N-acetyltransferase [Myxococcales bacterium]|nr:ribosomal protein S18-alanine N-acetyltransferase [Myxococcales bacterium]